MLEEVIGELERWPVHECAGSACDVCQPHVLAERLRALDGSTDVPSRTTADLSRRTRDAVVNMRPSGSLPRVVDPSMLARPSSIFEALVEVEGKWLRLGSLRRAECMSAAVAARRKSQQFGSMADALEALGQVTGSRPIARTLTAEKIDQICRKACFDYRTVLLGAADVHVEPERVTPRLEATA